MATEDETAELRQLREEVQRLQAQLATYEVGWPPGHFYSPIPSLEEVRRDKDRIFAVPSEIAGIELDPKRQLRLLDSLRGYFDEQPFADGPQPHLRYFFENDYYRHGDALVLYALMRHVRPRRVVEIGSGYSSAVLLDTNERFLDNSIACTFIEPEPERLLALLRPDDLERIDLIQDRIQGVYDRPLSKLGADDFLFIDSSHVSKVGSDVNTIFFEVLPSLAAGVYVHFHDVYYPFEYPAEWINEGRAWNEAYLLRAFLEYNREFEIVLFNSYLASLHRSAWLERLPLAGQSATSSIWLRRIEG